MGDIHQAALKGSIFLVREWDATEVRVNKNRTGFLWDTGGMGWTIWSCERVELYWTG